MKIGREKFWVDGMGAEARYAGDGILGRYDLFQYGQPDLVVWSVGKDRWLDPFSADEVRLEVLLDGLERLVPFVYIRRSHIGAQDPPKDDWYYDVMEAGRFPKIASSMNRRTAIILAICKLTNVRVTG